MTKEYDIRKNVQRDSHSDRKMNPLWQHPFNCMVSGPTQSGKTEFVKKFIKHVDKMMFPVPKEIIWCYGAWQKGYETLNSSIKLQEGIPKWEEWTDDKQRLVVLDDLMTEIDASITRLFTKGSHHRNMSIIFIVQNLFNKNPEQRTISLNSHYLVLFKNPRDATQITHLGKQMYPGKGSLVQDSYKDATSKPHGYLLIDFRQDTPDHLRLRSDIFPPKFETVYLQG